MEVCTAKKSDIVNRLPGIRVPVDEQFFGKWEHKTVVLTVGAGLSRVPEQKRATQHAVA